jgi:aspartyl protease family protein
MDEESIASLIYLGLLLAAVGGWAIVEYRARMGQALRVAAAWGLIFLALAAGYGIWGNLRGDILPSQSAAAGSVTSPRAQDGHYYVNMQLNGTPLTLLADTGASGIVLTQTDAAAIGIDLGALRYLGTALTANGPVRTARVKLDSITLGPFSDTNITAFVTEGEMFGSLLGMEYLGRFDVALRGGEMLITR